jgi:hypothetical protein
LRAIAQRAVRNQAVEKNHFTKSLHSMQQEILFSVAITRVDFLTRLYVFAGLAVSGALLAVLCALLETFWEAVQLLNWAKFIRRFTQITQILIVVLLSYLFAETNDHVGFPYFLVSLGYLSVLLSAPYALTWGYVGISVFTIVFRQLYLK